MTQGMVKEMTDEDLVQLIAWGEQELRERTARKKQETITKIRLLAAQAGVSLTIQGVKGRPTKSAGGLKQARRAIPARTFRAGV